MRHEWARPEVDEADDLVGQQRQDGRDHGT
jgi:hypothetical protein